MEWYRTEQKYNKTEQNTAAEYNTVKQSRTDTTEPREQIIKEQKQNRTEYNRTKQKRPENITTE